jgi:hypothetical protein
MTFPRNVGLPLYYNYKNTGRPTMNEPESVFGRIISMKKHPLYPFGHGLVILNLNIQTCNYHRIHLLKVVKLRFLLL